MTDWPGYAIWWQLHPISFSGAEPTVEPGTAPAPRLGRIEAWLDYLVELGCNGLALGPVFASESHGYDTVDHYRIDPRLGTNDDFDQLVAQCRERGVRLLLDGVFNHVGRGFPAFQDVLAHGRSSPYASWFRPTLTPRGPTDRRAPTASAIPTSRGATTWSRSTTPSPPSRTTSPASCGTGWTAARPAGGSTPPTPCR